MFLILDLILYNQVILQLLYELNEKIQTLRGDVSDGEMELQEQIDTVNRRTADLSGGVVQLRIDVSAADEQLSDRIEVTAEHLAELEDAD